MSLIMGGQGFPKKHEGYLSRDTAGKCYELTTGWPYTFDPSIKTLDLEALIAEGTVGYHIPGAESNRVANLAFCATRV